MANLGLIIGLLLQIALSFEQNPCVPRNYGFDSVVCVCNSTYCDNEDLSLSQDAVSVFTTSKDGKRFHADEVHFTADLNANSELLVITVDDDNVEQEITGFGGALSDAAAINILSLSPNAQENLLKSYFGSGGAKYNMIRIPMAGCDFSTREYTYLDTPNDYNLETFALADEDIHYKIPLLRRIEDMSDEKLHLFGSPWTAPSWMKTNNRSTGMGKLKGHAGGRYSKTWANYFVKFLDAYQDAGFPFWGITTQNEPSMGHYIPGRWQETGWSAQSLNSFIKTDLGPALHENNYQDLKVISLDDQRMFLRDWAGVLYSDPVTNQYVDGLGIHWYWNWGFPASIQREEHYKNPDKFMIATEACNINQNRVLLGDWHSGVKYSLDILENLNNWAIGWVDWNLCLNMEGGPNWVKNFVDSPIIVNAAADEFYRQPMYYHMAHFSKFLVEGSVKINFDTSIKVDNLKLFTGKNPDGRLVLVAVNKDPSNIPATILHGNKRFDVVVPSHSIQTYTWA